jgi:hypothetical protein
VTVKLSHVAPHGSHTPLLGPVDLRPDREALFIRLSATMVERSDNFHDLCGATPQDTQLMPKHRVLSFKSYLRLEWRGQDGQNETEQPDHSASLGDSITASTQIR